MKVQDYILVVSLVFLCGYDPVSGSVLNFKSSVNEIFTNLTRSLTLRCSLEDTYVSGVGAIVGRSVGSTPSNVAFLSSLVIMRDGHGVASVTEHSKATAVTDLDNLKVVGNLTSDSGQKGYIELTWSDPTDQQGGEYTCEANALTLQSHNVIFSRSLEVEVKVPNTSHLVNSIHACHTRLDQLESTVHQLVLTTQHVETGYIDCNSSRSWPGRDTDDLDGIFSGHTHRYLNVTQQFEKPYVTPPVVYLAVRDMYMEANPYFQFFVLDVDNDSFTMVCRAWDDDYLRQLSVSWISIPV